MAEAPRRRAEAAIRVAGAAEREAALQLLVLAPGRAPIAERVHNFVVLHPNGDECKNADAAHRPPGVEPPPVGRVFGDLGDIGGEVDGLAQF